MAQQRSLALACVAAGALGVLAPSGLAVITLDGSIAGDSYGPARAVQTVQTQFGDNLSELNAGYARIDGSNLVFVLTGQVENNFNKLNIFIDSRAGGQNSILPDANSGGNNPTNDGWAFKYSNNQLSGGFTFDAGFAADYMLIARNGFDGSTNRFDLDFAELGGGAGAFVAAGNIFGGSLTGSNASALPNGIGAGYNNSNTGGVTGGTGAADPVAAAAVETGLELSIPLSVLGNPGVGDVIRISAHINGSNHDFLSNQSLGGFAPPQGNLGGDGNGNFIGHVAPINFNNFAGDQFFTIVVPEPASLSVLSLAGVFLLARRRAAR
jgi:hypothetical protein